MLTLYAVPISLYCAKLRIIMRHKHLEWVELPPPGGYGSDQYRALVPAGNLPALKHGDLLLGDSEAIAEYLDEIFSSPAMLPNIPRERAKARELSRFHDTRLEPALRALFPHIGSLSQADNNQHENELIAKHWFMVQERLVQIEPLLPQPPKGPQPLMIGDCGFPITCTWIAALASHFNIQPILNKPVQAYLDRLSMHEAVRAELADYQPKLHHWLTSQ